LIAAEAWGVVLSRARARLPKSTISLWIEPLRPLAITDGKLVLTCDVKTIDWTRRRYAHFLGEVTRNHTSLEGVVLREEEIARAE
jgi:hypothetical protein